MVTPPPIQVANLGMADSLILMVMALVVFGPRRLPQIGRQIGKLMYEFRKASNDFKFQMEEELRLSEDAERRKKEEERLRAIAAEAPALTSGAETAADTPVPDGQFPIPTPYPGEALYPSMIDAPAAAQAEETVPRIQPPSTGEPVAAARPGSLASQLEPPAEPAAPTAAELAYAEAALAAKAEPGSPLASAPEKTPTQQTAEEPVKANG